MECGRYAITALAIAVIMAGGWFAWLGMFAGGAALIGAAVSIQTPAFQTRADPRTLDNVTNRIVLLTTLGFPGSLGFLLWWMAIQVSLSKNILLAYLIGAAGVVLAVSLSATFERLKMHESSADSDTNGVQASRRRLALVLVLVNVALGLYPAPLFEIITEWNVLIGTYP